MNQGWFGPTGAIMDLAYLALSIKQERDELKQQMDVMEGIDAVEDKRNADLGNAIVGELRGSSPLGR